MEVLQEATGLHRLQQNQVQAIVQAVHHPEAVAVASEAVVEVPEAVAHHILVEADRVVQAAVVVVQVDHHQVEDKLTSVYFSKN